MPTIFMATAMVTASRTNEHGAHRLAVDPLCGGKSSMDGKPQQWLPHATRPWRAQAAPPMKMIATSVLVTANTSPNRNR
jgi:hypothetical protein